MPEIPAGWSSAINQAELPTQFLTQAANTQLAQANTQVAQTRASEEAALAPIQTQLAQNTLAASNAQAPVTQLNALATQQGLENNLIASAASRAQASDNPAQTWDEEMKNLASQGVDRATQLAQAGYSSKLAQTVETFAGSAPVGRTQLAGAGASPQGGENGLTNYSPYDQQIERTMAQANLTTPAQQQTFLQGKVQTLDQVRQAILAIERSPDPIAAFNQHATALAPILGIPNPAGRFDGNPQGLEAWINGDPHNPSTPGAKAEIEGLEGAFQTRLARTNLGLSQPLAQGQIEKTDAGTFLVRPDGRGGISSMPIGPVGREVRQDTFTDPQSGLKYPVYLNDRTGEESVGKVPIDDTKPGATRETATMTKLKALTAAGMEPLAAAQLVSGDRPMTQPQIQIEAAKIASAEIARQSGGLPDPDSVKKTADLQEQIAAQLTAANSMPASQPDAGAAPGGRPGADAPGYNPAAFGPKPGANISSAQRDANLAKLSSNPKAYKEARDDLIETQRWQAFDAHFGRGASAAVVAAKNRNAYTGP